MPRPNKATTFSQQVLAALCLIPRGRVATYSGLAKYLGRPGAARAVGNALHHNPDAPTVPCHRVVCADGRLGGYAGGIKQKIALLAAEGVVIKKLKVLDFEKVLYKLSK